MADKNRPNGDNHNPMDDYRSDDLRDSPMMAHLMDALEAGEDIGHYGRLVFAMVARYFLEEDELISLLSGQPDMDEQGVRAMLLQIQQRDYNPPKRETILEWQSQQDFQICPDENNPRGCNVYRELRFPDEIYDRIGDFWRERAEEES